ncbi:MAG: class I SAM-dependent methyltransferase [Candidatus Peribacteraceae bacterium]|jgi:2-polyprenyl-3-methyl-5-hydroxy-6-metoxy-1,4-benzoquinol methylase
MSTEPFKEVYRSLSDRITEKRYHSASPIRRHAHRTQYETIVALIPAGCSVLDAGCGEGVLSILLAQKGCRVTGLDYSAPNVEAAKAYAREAGVEDRTTFLEGDAEHVPFPDRSFDWVVSSHVLEHLPDFVQGAREIARVAHAGAVVAVPTCLGPASWVLLGGDKFWTVSRRTPIAIFIGLFRVLGALLREEEGVDERYEGRHELPHISRFPWRARRLLEEGGLHVRTQRASSFTLPYVTFLVPLSRFLERFAGVPILRSLGHGTTFACTSSGSVS